MSTKVTISTLQQMKREGKKSIGIVAWDYQIARIADRAGVDFISVGDLVGVNLWGRADVADVTLDEMLICCKAVRAGAQRALVSCDMPFGPVQLGVDSALAAAARLIKEGGADMAWLSLDEAAQLRSHLGQATRRADDKTEKSIFVGRPVAAANARRWQVQDCAWFPV